MFASVGALLTSNRLAVVVGLRFGMVFHQVPGSDLVRQSAWSFGVG
jgi:hypothetical protein